MTLAQEGKLKALQAAMSKIENVEVIPTGSISLDAALGVADTPRDE